MKKKLLSLALAAVAAFGISASAQQAQQNKMYTPQTFTDYAFEGVLLDIPQQTRIDSLHSALRTPARQKMQGVTMCPDSAKARAQRPQNCCADSSKACAQRPMKGGKQRMRGNAMGVMPGVEYVAKVQEILTPDQFDIFMTNIQAMPENAVNNLLPVVSRDQAAPNAQAGRPDKQFNKASGNCDKSKAKADGRHKDKKDKKDNKDKKADKAKKQDKSK